MPAVLQSLERTIVWAPDGQSLAVHISHTPHHPDLQGLALFQVSSGTFMRPELPDTLCWGLHQHGLAYSPPSTILLCVAAAVVEQCFRAAMVDAASGVFLAEQRFGLGDRMLTPSWVIWSPAGLVAISLLPMMQFAGEPGMVALCRIVTGQQPQLHLQHVLDLHGEKVRPSCHPGGLLCACIVSTSTSHDEDLSLEPADPARVTAVVVMDMQTARLAVVTRPCSGGNSVEAPDRSSIKRAVWLPDGMSMFALAKDGLVSQILF